MKWFCHDIILSCHENQWSLSPDSFIRPRQNYLCLSCTGYFIQFEKVFHSLIRVRCMVFELREVLASGMGHLNHSLPDPNLFSQLQQRPIIFYPSPNAVQHLISPSFNVARMVSSILVPIVSRTSLLKGVWSSATKATRLELYDEIPRI